MSDVRAALNGAHIGGDHAEPRPDYDDYEDEIDGCLHGIPWDQDCWECEMEEDRLEYGIL